MLRRNPLAANPAKFPIDTPERARLTTPMGFFSIRFYGLVLWAGTRWSQLGRQSAFRLAIPYRGRMEKIPGDRLLSSDVGFDMSSNPCSGIGGVNESLSAVKKAEYFNVAV